MAFTTIQGSGANDATSFVGTSGVDTITINAGTITGAGTVFAGAQEAADTINVLSPSGGVTGYTLRGGQGTDTLALIANTSITNSFLNGNSNNDTINIANSFTSTVQGGQGNDNITTGLLFQSLVNGNKNNDTLATTGVQGGSLLGGQGNDALNVNAGNNNQNSAINGDNDNDTITVAAATSFSNVSLLGGQGNDSIQISSTATGNDDRLTAFTNSTAFGGEGNDTINASQGGDANAIAVNLQGEDGNDQLTGGTGADILGGGAGNDSITSTGGADTITGGTGADSMAAGAGNQRFVQNQGDSVAATTGWGTLGAGGVIQATSTITFGNSVDIIANFNAAGTDTLAVGSNGATSLLAGGGVVATNAATGNYFVQGTWNAANNTFTVGTGGGDTDSLFLQTTGTNITQAANNGLNAVVFIGTVIATGDVVA